MTTLHDIAAEANIARLNAFLDRFPEDIDPDFDDAGDELDRQFAELRLAINHN